MPSRPLIELKKRTVLITGITSGIGKEIALKFAKAGWGILGHYHASEEKAAEVSKQLDKYGRRCLLFRADFTSSEELTNFVKKISRFNIHSLINNAGTYLLNKNFSDLTIEEISKIFMVNTFAPIVITSALLPRMKMGKFGRIVNISSIAAKYGGSSLSLAYGCSKRALEGLTKTIAKEGAGDNILVNSVRPGVIDTDFHKKFPKDMKKRISMIPLKKMGSPDDVAQIVYYLASEKNNFITNETITVSGGE